ncbi:helix-turn-helix domain-containing protein [Streptomyces sp. URMC 123]|uniref:AraC family transcriptional regulator n=1 Tax=Streptomyces sp. URMC 123 TaxID=3423403 RepID=UPI003F1D28A2
MQRWADPHRGVETVWALPCPRLRPMVHRYRGHRLALDRPRRRLELPSGAITLVLGFEGELRVSDVAGAVAGLEGPSDASRAPARRSLLSPLRTRGSVGEHSGRLHGMEVVLAPWAAFGLFGVAMHEWDEGIVDPREQLGQRVDELTDALSALTDWRERFELLDTVLAQWAERGLACSPRVLWAWNELCRTGGAVPIRRLAARTGWGWRQFDSRFREQIGLPPKSAARILRLRRALRLLSHGRSPAQTAIICGFSDQAHFSRETKRMTGYSPGRLLSARACLAQAPAADDRMEGEVTSVLLAT